MKKSRAEEIYKSIAISDLILASLYNLENLKKDIGFEKILSECLNLFPEKFNFSNNPKWPDARKIDRPLRALKKEKMVSFEPEKRFSLTLSGRKKALEVVNLLRQKRLKLS